MAVRQNDDGSRGDLRDFELEAACLFPHDPTVKRKSSKVCDGKQYSVIAIMSFKEALY